MLSAIRTENHKNLAVLYTLVIVDYKVHTLLSMVVSMAEVISIHSSQLL